MPDISDNPSVTSSLLEPPPLPTEREPGLDFDALVTGKNLFRIGLGLVLLALGFLFRYGWQQGWITPTAQIGAGVAGSLAFLILGERLRGARDAFGHMLQGGGVAGLYLTAFAAHKAFAMTDTTVAFVHLIAISALGIGLSLRRQSVVLAGISVAGAYAAPFLIGGRLADGLGDVVYLGVVTASAVALAFKKEWPSLYGVASLGAFAVAVTDTFVEVFGGEIGTGAPLAFTLTMYALLGVGPTVANLVLKTGDRVVLAAAPIVAVGAGLFASLHFDAAPGVRAAVALGIAVVHLGFYLAASDRSQAELQLVPAALFGLGAAAALFDGDVTSLAAAGVGAGLVLLGARVRRLPIEIGGSVLFGAAATYTLAASTVDAMAVSAPGTIIARFGVFAIAGLVAFIEFRRTGSSLLATASALIAYAGTMILTFTELAPVNVALVTAVWGAIGTGLLAVGHQMKVRPTALTGLATIALTIGKLFLVDLAAADPIWRISLFAGFGLALLAVGYWISRDEGR